MSAGAARPFVWSARIRFADTDASGRIHYTAMFRHFEAAETEFLRALGCEYAQFDGAHVSFPRVRVECDFLSELRFDDEAGIAVDVERVGNSSFTLVFQADKEGRSAARGRIVIVAMDRQTKRPCPIPERLATALRACLSA